MFSYNLKVSIEDAPAAILDLVSSTRLAIMSGENEYVASGRVAVELKNGFILSIVNNSHAFGDGFEGAAILEVALLHNGKLVCDEHGCNDLTIVNGIDYHRLIHLFKRVNENKYYSIFNLWLDCYTLEYSRDPDYEEPDFNSVKDYLIDVENAIYKAAKTTSVAVNA